MPKIEDIKLDLEEVEAAASHSSAVAGLPRTRPSDWLEAVVRFVGNIFIWTWVPLILLIVANVILRYAVGRSFIAMEELQWHLYAVGFMIALSYGVLNDSHVRVDVVAEHMEERTRAWIELFGLLFLLLPFAWIMVEYALPVVQRSYRIGEVSSAPGGLPMRWILKSFLVSSFALIFLAGLARFLRITALLFGFPKPRNRH